MGICRCLHCSEVPQLLLFSLQKLPDFFPKEALQQVSNILRSKVNFLLKGELLSCFREQTPRQDQLYSSLSGRLLGACFHQKVVLGHDGS